MSLGKCKSSRRRFPNFASILTIQIFPPVVQSNLSPTIFFLYAATVPTVQIAFLEYGYPTPNI